MSDNFEKYSEYNKILRSWFVAFGIGGPALFLVNDAVRNKLSESADLKLVAILFLLGAAAQILVAFINKITNWYIYHGTQDETFTDTRRYKTSIFN